jgi:modulator of FtsH protease HflC
MNPGVAMRIALLIFVIAAAALVAWMSVVTVDPTEYVYVTQFGRHVATYDGSLTDADSGAGLHFRWPWPVQTVRRLDRRLQHFDLPAIELLTRDSSGSGEKGGGSVDKTLTVEAYVCWRIADQQSVDDFVRRIDTPARAREILGQRINSEIGALIGQMHMDDLISTDGAKIDGREDGFSSTKVDQTMGKLRTNLLDSLQNRVLKEYGIQIVDVRLKRFNHPVKVRDTIFSRIISERELKAAYYRNLGRKHAEDIRTIADAKVEELSKAAEKVEKETKREAEAQALMILADAFAQDPGFFRFWNEMEQMKAILGNPKTTLLLSTHRSVFDFLFNVPGPSGQPAAPRLTPPDRGENRLDAAPGKEKQP